MHQDWARKFIFGPCSSGHVVKMTMGKKDAFGVKVIFGDVFFKVLLLHQVFASRIHYKAGAGLVVQHESVHFQLIKNKIFECDHCNKVRTI
jgi:hypothetical protein